MKAWGRNYLTLWVADEGHRLFTAWVRQHLINDADNPIDNSNDISSGTSSLFTFLNYGPTTDNKAAAMAPPPAVNYTTPAGKPNQPPLPSINQPPLADATGSPVPFVPSIDNTVNNGDDASNIDDVNDHINCQHLRIWGAADANNPVNSSYGVSNGDIVSDDSVVDNRNDAINHQFALPRPHPPNQAVAPSYFFKLDFSTCARSTMSSHQNNNNLIMVQ